MTQTTLASLVPVNEEHPGLISPASLALATAQLPTPKHRNRITIVCCDTTPAKEGIVAKAFPHKIAATG